MKQIITKIPDDERCHLIGGKELLSVVLQKTLYWSEFRNNPYYEPVHNRIDTIIQEWLELVIVNNFDEILSRVVNERAYNEMPREEGERYLVLYENRGAKSAWYEARFETNRFIRPNGDSFPDEKHSVTGIVKGITKVIPLKYFLKAGGVW